MKRDEKDLKIVDLEHTIEYFISSVIGGINSSRRLVEDSRVNGLTLNQLEAEGSLRAYLSILERFKDWDAYSASVVERVLKREEE